MLPSCDEYHGASTGEELHVAFLDVAIEFSADCDYDYLEMREGHDETGRLIGRLCGEGSAGSLKSSKSIWMKFVSDKSVANKGFMASYWKEGI